jgi:hypothetical protein
MSEYFQKVKAYLHELNLHIKEEIPADEIVIVTDAERGIVDLMIDCEDPILIMEQVILKLQGIPENFCRRLLQMNRTLVHGAFVLDDDGTTILFRDTLQLKNLDLNELEGSINSLSLALAEYADEFINVSRQF